MGFQVSTLIPRVKTVRISSGEPFPLKWKGEKPSVDSLGCWIGLLCTPECPSCNTLAREKAGLRELAAFDQSFILLSDSTEAVGFGRLNNLSNTPLWIPENQWENIRIEDLHHEGFVWNPVPLASK